MNLIYNILLTLAMPLVLMRWWWRGRAQPGYRAGINERFGYYTGVALSESIWIHAVSFGEMVAADQLVQHLLKSHPNTPIVITNMTATGAKRTQARFGQGQYSQVTHLYLPYDLPFAVRRFFDQFRPKIGIIMETELWPNLLKNAHERNIPVILANARLSKRSTQGYARIRSFTRTMLNQIAHIGAQSRTDAKRFRFLGAKSQNISVLGNLKFDLQPPKEQISQAAQDKSSRPTIVAASTHEGEENLILESFTQVRTHLPDALLVLVPRHPERFEKVAKLCAEHGYRVARRSLGQNESADIDILLGDTMGEMFYFYALGDVAIVGGSFTPIGGHNILEPIVLNLPVITGPHLFHLAEIQSRFPKGRCRAEVNTATELCDMIVTLLVNQKLKVEMVDAAQKIYQENQGALRRYAQLIERVALRGQTAQRHPV